MVTLKNSGSRESLCVAQNIRIVKAALMTVLYIMNILFGDISADIHSLLQVINLSMSTH